jgi:hypothetical protein
VHQPVLDEIPADVAMFCHNQERQHMSFRLSGGITSEIVSLQRLVAATIEVTPQGAVRLKSMDAV